MRKRQVDNALALDPSSLQLMAIPEVAKLLSVGRSTIYELMASCEIESVKVRNARRILAVSVQAYIQRQRKAG